MVLTDPDATKFTAAAVKVRVYLADWRRQGGAEASDEVSKSSRRAQRRLTPEQVEKLIADYKAGSTVYELADEFRCDRTTVSKKLKDAGITLRCTPPTEQQIDEMVRLYESGLSLERTGERVGFTAHTVLKYIRECGVKVRDAHGVARG